VSDFNAWMALQSAMRDDGTRRTVRRATLRRVARFAAPHRRTIASFLVLATVGAVLGVAAPVLAGRAVDAIVDGAGTRRVVLIALAIAAVALAEAGFGLLERLQSARLSSACRSRFSPAPTPARS
jgi:ABC-type bacteriocin/lantibiotic exporter with double-glycine peptidase domain